MSGGRDGEEMFRMQVKVHTYIVNSEAKLGAGQRWWPRRVLVCGPGGGGSWGIRLGKGGYGLMGERLGGVLAGLVKKGMEVWKL
jgi:hypothetical protein